ncbi:HAD hydrolase-like protein [Sneathiella sp.]|uniref:HAD-IIA family hydrolase n=1 Tax=Sneathiella sp. TaxID=1964365 RepID=UPI0026340EE2|nr:HAD hydrolase-like protein [Sneathiella sp.]MDF2365821.1 HAD hydrolase-like protein [Sneathiella sp.]
MSFSPLTAMEVFERYEAIRPRLPTAQFPSESIAIENLEMLIDEFDVFLLDAFGVLNVGESAIPGAAERLEAFSRLGKKIFVLTNSATYDATKSLEKYRRFGFDLVREQVISSRDAAITALNSYPDDYIWGVAATSHSGLEELSRTTRLLGEDPSDYDMANAFLFLSSADWTAERQSLLRQSLQENPRPMLVGNPDLVAPRERGLSLEPGFFSHEIADQAAIVPDFYGKPFSNVFDRVLEEELKGTDRRRIAMVGDTLHTDILGGAAAGVRTVLVTGHGLLKGMDIPELIERSGIVPDFIAATT